MKFKRDVTFRIKEKQYDGVVYYRPERQFNFLGIKIWIPFIIYMQYGSIMLGSNSWRESRHLTKTDIEQYCFLKNFNLIWK